jgi:stage III sporulation protein AB
MLIKLLGSIVIITSTALIGFLLAKAKTERVNQLRDFLLALNMLEIEIKFALTALPDAFIKIGKAVDARVGQIFILASSKILHEKMSACQAWQMALKGSESLSINLEEKEILSKMGSSLGEIDSENQIKNIKFTIEELKRQQTKAEEEKNKSEKLFKSLGVLTGVGIVILIF